METQAEYQTKPAGLFHALATETKIWTWCPCCLHRTDQVFIKDEEQFELYQCECCNQIHKIAVR